MGADLTIAAWTRRQSVLLMDDHLVVLEHEGYSDRVHRVFFDGVRSLVVWKRWPWGRMLLLGCLTALPGYLIYSLGGAGEVIGGIFFAVGAILELRYLVYRLTTIRLQDGPRSRDFGVIVRPGRIRDVVDRLRARIEAAQEQEIRRAAEREAERTGSAPATPQEAPQ